MSLSTFLQEAGSNPESQSILTKVIEEFTADTVIFIIVGGLVLLWLSSVGFFLYKMIRKYPLGDWDENNKNPYENETLAMPRGTFRGILTMSLLVIVLILEVVSLKMPLIELPDGTLISLEDKIDQLMIAFQMMLAFYFGSKVMHHVTAADARKTKEIAQASAAVSKQPTQTAEFEESGSVG